MLNSPHLAGTIMGNNYERNPGEQLWVARGWLVIILLAFNISTPTERE